MASEYFQHDYNPTSDPKIAGFIGQFGASGYGVWWRLIEMLHAEEEHRLPHKRYITLGISRQLMINVDDFETMLESLINDYELLKSDGEYFWSDRVLKNIEKREEISRKRSEAGKASANKRSTSVEQELTSVEQNPTNKIKGNKIEIKEKEKETNKRDPALEENLNYPDSLEAVKTQCQYNAFIMPDEVAQRFYDRHGANSWCIPNNGHWLKIQNWKKLLVSEYNRFYRSDMEKLMKETTQTIERKADKESFLWQD